MGILFDRTFVNRFMYWLGEKIDNGQWEYVYLGYRRKYEARAGGLDWHPSASVFNGAGITDTGALFSYHANWEAPGRWSVEVLTKEHRLILRPLEELQVQNLGSVSVEKMEIADKLDKSYTPGFYRETESFLGREHGNPTPLAD
jgi:hypothetical protein